MSCFTIFCKICIEYVFSSNMFEFIFDPVHGLPRELRNECHRKYARGEVPYYLHTMKYYLLYSSINYNCCFDNKSSRFFKDQARSQ